MWAQAKFQFDSIEVVCMKEMPSLPRYIFASRWLQLPLYVGLIAAQAVYVFHFWVELVHLLEAAMGNRTALDALILSIGYKSDVAITHLNARRALRMR